MDKTTIKYIYLAGVLLLLGTLLLFGFKWLGATPAYFFVGVAMTITALVFSIEMLQALYRLIIKIVSHPVRKWVFITIGAFVLTLIGIVAKIESNKLIHSFTKVDPSNFPYTHALLFFLTSLAIWLIIAALSLIIAAFFYVIYLNASPFIEMFRGTKTTGVVLAFGRIIGACSTAMYLLLGLAFLSNTSQSLPKLLVYADYMPGSDCSNLKLSEYAVKLSDGNISVAIPKPDGSYTFETRKCEPLPQVYTFKASADRPIASLTINQ